MNLFGPTGVHILLPRLAYTKDGVFCGRNFELLINYIVTTCWLQWPRSFVKFTQSLACHMSLQNVLFGKNPVAFWMSWASAIGSWCGTFLEMRNDAPYATKSSLPSWMFCLSRIFCPANSQLFRFPLDARFKRFAIEFREKLASTTLRLLFNANPYDLLSKVRYWDRWTTGPR